MLFFFYCFVEQITSNRYPVNHYTGRIRQSLFVCLLRGRPMDVTLHATSGAPSETPSKRVSVSEFSFIPDTLRTQCRSLIQTYHAMHGYSCLPNMLWKAGLGGFIEKHRNLSEAFKKASTTRSARKSNDLFVNIATEVLSLEVLAREYANWSAILPAAKVKAIELLDESAPGARTWLMEHYLYPPRYDSPAAVIALAPSPNATRHTRESSAPPIGMSTGSPGTMSPGTTTAGTTGSALMSFKETMQAYYRPREPALVTQNSQDS